MNFLFKHSKLRLISFSRNARHSQNLLVSNNIFLALPARSLKYFIDFRVPCSLKMRNTVFVSVFPAFFAFGPKLFPPNFMTMFPWSLEPLAGEPHLIRLSISFFLIQAIYTFCNTWIFSLLRFQLWDIENFRKLSRKVF